jgi:hypothetical protein
VKERSRSQKDVAILRIFRFTEWMFGPEILVRSLSKAVPTGSSGELWQYHSRGDRHSKIACWGTLFDVLRHCAKLREHVAKGRVGFGINHEMRDFIHGRKKNLDLVLCTPADAPLKKAQTFASLVQRYQIVLTSKESESLDALPELKETKVGAVQAALEAKACMTEHVKARPRLYDELHSSHQTIHGASSTAIAIGFVMVNLATEFQSPSRGEPSHHKQPAVTERVIEKIRELPRRSSTGQSGFDAIGVVVIDCRNDGSHPVELVSQPPAPAAEDILNYSQMILRIAHLYESRFPQL